MESLWESFYKEKCKEKEITGKVIKIIQIKFIIAVTQYSGPE